MTTVKPLGHLSCTNLLMPHAQARRPRGQGRRQRTASREHAGQALVRERPRPAVLVWDVGVQEATSSTDDSGACTTCVWLRPLPRTAGSSSKLSDGEPIPSVPLNSVGARKNDDPDPRRLLLDRNSQPLIFCRLAGCMQFWAHPLG